MSLRTDDRPYDGTAGCPRRVSAQAPRQAQS